MKSKKHAAPGWNNRPFTIRFDYDKTSVNGEPLWNNIHCGYFILCDKALSVGNAFTSRNYPMETAKKIMKGDTRSASLLIRNLEDRDRQATSIIKDLYPNTGKAHVIGFTGSPGAGKSTLIDRTIAEYRKRGKTVGALLVDPSSPFSGGALLGDRVRMERHIHDQDVFIRSMSSRGALGGLSRAVGEAIHVLDAMGKDVIILETVGTGQMGIDVINHAHTVVVVQIPGMGDEIQILKAGILEIADIFIINKEHQMGAGKLYQELMNMLNMVDKYPGGWRPPIIMAGNVAEEKPFEARIEALVNTIEDHYTNIVTYDLFSERVKRKIVLELNDAIESVVLEPIIARLIASGEFERMVTQVFTRQSDPGTIADEVARRYLSQHVQPD
jgi:LAO/AO transport system kinase